MFYLIGLGLGDVTDISVKGLSIVKKCQRVYLEAYTSILACGPHHEKLEEFYGKEVVIADREFVEQSSDELLAEAEHKDVCLLVVGDPFGATTHCDLLLRAKAKNITVNVIHNASIMNAIGCCGLQLYNFGETVSIVFWTETWKPESYYDKIAANKKRGLHTLCLLDIKVKEPDWNAMMRKKKQYEPPRYMSAAVAASQLLEISSNRILRNEDTAYDASTTCVALARVGWDDQRIVSCSLKDMSNQDLGPPLHSLIICGDLHPIEEDMLKLWSL